MLSLDCTDHTGANNQYLNSSILCDSNYVFNHSDSILYKKIATHDSLWLSRTETELTTDFEIGTASIYLTLNGSYKSALSVLPECLIRKFNSNRLSYERFDYSLGYFQNFAIWLNYYLNESSDFEEAKRLFYSVLFQGRELDQVNHLNSIIECYLSNECGKNGTVATAEYESLPFDILLRFLAAEKKFLNDKNANAYLASLLALVDDQALMHESLLRTAINLTLRLPTPDTNLAIRLVSRYDQLNTESCLFPKILYSQLLGTNRVSSCQECIEHGGKMDSLMAFAYLAIEAAKEGTVGNFTDLEMQHFSSQDHVQLFVPSHVREAEYGIFLKARLLYFMAINDKINFWNTAKDIDVNPVVPARLGDDTEVTKGYLSELYFELNGSDESFEQFYLDFLSPK